MNTNEFISLLEASTDADGMARDGVNGLLFFTSQAQGILLNTPAEQNVIFGSDGKLPVLNTIDNTYEYQAPSNYFRIAGILVESGAAGSMLDSFWFTDYWPVYSYSSLHRSNRKIETIDIAGVQYARIQFVRSYDAGDNTNARVIFTENPGSTTDVYRWYAYQKPTNLLSDSIPLGVKPPYDYLYLLPLTIALIQAYKDGNVEQGIIKAETIKRQYNKEINKGEQGESYEAIDRGF